jgi:NACalpha-BTF3-like transcription factor
LCIDFFLEVDKLLGTNYHAKFGSRQHSEDVMLARMAQIASTHCLGVLVIDEIQHLSTAKSGGSDKMLNFFVKLVNTIGVPVIRIGTNKALPVLQGDFRQARRGTGEGGVYWDRLSRETKRDEEIWRFFIETFFEYQWTRKPAALDYEMDDVLYDESQGIVDIAIKLFMIAQWRAIALGTEAVTPALVMQVAADSLHLVRPMLDALKSGDPDRIAKYSDIRPLDIGNFYEQYRSKLEAKKLSELRKLRTPEQSSADAPSLLNEVIIQLMNLDLPPSLAKLHAEKVIAMRKPGATVAELTTEAYKAALSEGPGMTGTSAVGERKATSKEPRSKSFAPDDLRLIVAEAKKSKSSGYQALKNHGAIKSPTQDGLVEAVAC